MGHNINTNEHLIVTWAKFHGVGFINSWVPLHIIPLSFKTYSSLASLSRIYTESPERIFQIPIKVRLQNNFLLLFHGLNKINIDSLIGLLCSERMPFFKDLVSTFILYSPIIDLGDEVISIVTISPSTLSTLAFQESSNTIDTLDEWRSSMTGIVICVLWA